MNFPTGTELDSMGRMVSVKVEVLGVSQVVEH